MTAPRRLFSSIPREPKKFPKPLQDRSKYSPDKTSGEGERVRRLRAVWRRQQQATQKEAA